MARMRTGKSEGICDAEAGRHGSVMQQRAGVAVCTAERPTYCCKAQLILAARSSQSVKGLNKQLQLELHGKLDHIIHKPANQALGLTSSCFPAEVVVLRNTILGC
jgi:hypothetical protein